MTTSPTTGTVDVAAVRRSHPIEDAVAASGVELRRTGRGWMGCCPFHDDSTASLSVGGVPDRFHCFGCGASGDVIDYIARLHGVGFRDAVTILEGQSPSRMPLSSLPAARSDREMADSRATVDRDRGCEINSLAWQWFSRPVAHAFACSYLRHHRSLDLRAAESETGQALVGHTGHGWTNLVDHLRSQGVSHDELLALDLAQVSRQGGLIDTLRDRLIVPIANHDGRISGFVGRDTSGNPRAPKYRNPSRTVTFDKSTCLYRPVRTAAEDATVIVAEGPLDALAITATAATAALTEQVIACSTLGTAVTPTQSRQVAALSNGPIVLALDGDRAGAEGTLRWVDALCRKQDALALVAQLPAGGDPAEWFAHHGAAGLAALDPAQRHTNIAVQELESARPRLPGRELAVLACRETEPIRAAVSDIRRLAPQLNRGATDGLVAGVVMEMTRQGWNPNHAFERALARARLGVTRAPPRPASRFVTPPGRDLL